MITCGYEVKVDTIPEGDSIELDITSDNLDENLGIEKITIIKGDVIKLLENRSNKSSIYTVLGGKYDATQKKWWLLLSKNDECEPLW